MPFNDTISQVDEPETAAGQDGDPRVYVLFFSRWEDFEVSWAGLSLKSAMVQLKEKSSTDWTLQEWDAGGKSREWTLRDDRTPDGKPCDPPSISVEFVRAVFDKTES